MARKKKTQNQSAAALAEEYTRAAELHWCEFGEACYDKEMFFALTELWGAVDYARNPRSFDIDQDDNGWFV